MMMSLLLTTGWVSDWVVVGQAVWVSARDRLRVLREDFSASKEEVQSTICAIWILPIPLEAFEAGQ